MQDHTVKLQETFRVGFQYTHTRAGNIRLSTVMPSSTTHTFTTPEPSSPGPVLPTITQSPAAPEHPPPPSDPPPSTSPLGGVMSGSFSGLLTTGPDNQRVCLCQCVIFKFFVYGQGFKRRYFYGNCRWSILLYIYVINM